MSEPPIRERGENPYIEFTGDGIYCAETGHRVASIQTQKRVIDGPLPRSDPYQQIYRPSEDDYAE